MERGHYNLFFLSFSHIKKKKKEEEEKNSVSLSYLAFPVFSSIIFLCILPQEGHSHILQFLLGYSNFIFLLLGSSNNSISVCRLTQAKITIIYMYILAHVDPNYGYRQEHTRA